MTNRKERSERLRASIAKDNAVIAHNKRLFDQHAAQFEEIFSMRLVNFWSYVSGLQLPLFAQRVASTSTLDRDHILSRIAELYGDRGRALAIVLLDNAMTVTVTEPTAASA